MNLLSEKYSEVLRENQHLKEEKQKEEQNLAELENVTHQKEEFITKINSEIEET